MRDIADTTFEGDNTVLLQQVTKSLLADYRSNPTAVDQVCKSNILFSDDDILLTSLKYLQMISNTKSLSEEQYLRHAFHMKGSTI